MVTMTRTRRIIRMMVDAGDEDIGILIRMAVTAIVAIAIAGAMDMGIFITTIIITIMVMDIMDIGDIGVGRDIVIIVMGGVMGGEGGCWVPVDGYEGGV